MILRVQEIYGHTLWTQRRYQSSAHMTKEFMQVYRGRKRSTCLSNSSSIVVWFTVQVEIQQVLDPRLYRLKRYSHDQGKYDVAGRESMRQWE
jgi:hypothetical protein